MTAAPTVTAEINNQTQYLLTFETNSIIEGRFSNAEPNSTQIPAGEQLQVFFASSAGAGSEAGCEGSVIYQFTDQNGNPQVVTLFYKDLYLGDNEFSATVPGGLSCTNDGPTHGDMVAVTYTISGTVS